MGEKKKIKFNILDVLIILVLIAAVAVFSYFAMGKWESNNAAGGEKLRYTIEFQNVNPDYAAAFEKGGNVSEIRKGGKLGTVVAAYKEPTKVIAENLAQGTYVETELEDEYTVRVTIESEYTESDSGFKINDLDLKVGKKIAVRTEYIAAEGTILAIEN